ncbi:MAG: phage portal protein, partial [Alphaproteobacteria bacterium]|nr:phage portal protein [Alphaproteobacteria bacterium]
DVSSPSAPVGVSDGTDGNPEGTPLDAAGNVWKPEDPVHLMPELAPGAYVPVAPGYKVNAALPKEVGQTYDVFVRRQLQRICATVGAPYELVTGDTPPGANERMMRIRIMDFFAQVLIWRRVMIRQFCNPAWRAFVLAAYASGKWTPKAGTTLQDYLRVEWRGAPMPIVNPFQENQADTLAIRSGYKTWSEVVRDRGGDPDLVLAERVAELKKIKSLGIVMDSDPRYTTRSGGSQARNSEFDFVLPNDGGDGDPDENIDL